MVEPAPPGPALLRAWIESGDPATRRRAIAHHTERTTQSVSGWLSGNVRPEVDARVILSVLTGIPALADAATWGAGERHLSPERIEAARAEGARLAGAR